MSFRRTITAVFILAVSSAAFCEDYEIRFDRTRKVGDRLRLVASGSIVENTTKYVDGQEPDKIETKIEGDLVSAVRILEVDELKRSKVIRMTIDKCLMSVNDGEKKQVLEKGTEVLVRRTEDKQEFLVDDQPVDANVKRFLNLFISLPSNKVTANEIFGTKERKKIGDSWSINSKNAAKSFATQNMKIDPKNIKGKFTLENVVLIEGVRCLRINGEYSLSIRGVEVDAGDGITLLNYAYSFEGSAAIPLDSKVVLRSEDGKIVGEHEFKFKQGEDMPVARVKTKTVKTLQYEFRRVK